MTVNELIGLLQECDPEAEVRIMSQEGWPFENGVAVREEFGGEECNCEYGIGEPHEEGCAAEDDGTGSPAATSSSWRASRSATAARTRGRWPAANASSATHEGRLPGRPSRCNRAGLRRRAPTGCGPFGVP